MRIAYLEEKTIDLASTPFQDWPLEARQMAYNLLCHKKWAEQFEQQLFPHSWLAQKVEQAFLALDDL